MFSYKKFFNSTALGLTAGILLAGYAVFAFQGPTAAPPAGNVAAPLNVGAGSQVKSGGLWVGSLAVDGSIKTGSFTSLPACDSVQKGSLVFNVNINKISVCTGTAWEVFSTGVDFDNDGVFAGTDCNDGDATKWQNLSCYTDNDGDGVRSTYTTTACSGASCVGSTGSPGTDCHGTDSTKWQFLTGYADSDGDTRTLTETSVCSGVSLPSPYLSTGSSAVDCNDSCATCYPGSTATTASPDGKDQDCNGVIDNSTAQSYSCSYLADPPDSTRAIRSAEVAACTALCGGTVSGSTSIFCGTIKDTFSWPSCSHSGNTLPSCQSVSYPSSTCTCPAVYH